MSYTELRGWGSRDEFAIYLTYHTIMHHKAWVWMATALNSTHTQKNASNYARVYCCCLTINNLQLFALCARVESPSKTGSGKASIHFGNISKRRKRKQSARTRLPKSSTFADEQLPKKTFAWNANKQRQSAASDNLSMVTPQSFRRLHIEYALNEH